MHDTTDVQDEVNRQVEARKRGNPLLSRSKTIIAVTQLLASRNLALRRNDHVEADKISAQIAAHGADPNTGELLANDGGGDDHDTRIQRINENNRRKTKEAMAAAHQAGLDAAIKRRKKEDEIILAKR